MKKFRERLMVMKAELEALSQATAEARKPVALDQQAVGRYRAWTLSKVRPCK